MKEWLKKYHLAVLVVVFGCLILWMMIPAPYGLRYLVKRVFWTPTFICADDTRSWAATRQGACSGHGGVKHKYEVQQ